MSGQPPLVSLGGIWYRHVRGGGDPHGMAPAGAEGRWQRARVVGAVYLADDPATTWAEFYRAAAAMRLPPDRLLPRDLWSYRVQLDEVADLTDPTVLGSIGLSQPVPDERQWATFQAAGEQLAHAGAQGIVWRSAALPAGRCLCVFASALAGLSPLKRQRIQAVPVPPRGMRT